MASFWEGLWTGASKGTERLSRGIAAERDREERRRHQRVGLLTRQFANTTDSKLKKEIGLEMVELEALPADALGPAVEATELGELEQLAPHLATEISSTPGFFKKMQEQYSEEALKRARPFFAGAQRKREIEEYGTPFQQAGQREAKNYHDAQIKLQYDKLALESEKGWEVDLKNMVKHNPETNEILPIEGGARIVLDTIKAKFIQSVIKKDMRGDQLIDHVAAGMERRGFEFTSEMQAELQREFASYRYALPFSSDENKTQSNARKIQRQVDNILLLMNKDEVWKAIGPVKGRKNVWEQLLTGGAAILKPMTRSGQEEFVRKHQPDLQRFMFTLGFTLDQIIRMQTGAAVTPQEAVLFDNILGGITMGREALATRMDEMINQMERTYASTWMSAWERKHTNAMTAAEEDQIPVYRRIATLPTGSTSGTQVGATVPYDPEDAAAEREIIKTTQDSIRDELWGGKVQKPDNTVVAGALMAGTQVGANVPQPMLPAPYSTVVADELMAGTQVGANVPQDEAAAVAARLGLSEDEKVALMNYLGFNKHKSIEEAITALGLGGRR